MRWFHPTPALLIAAATFSYVGAADAASVCRTNGAGVNVRTSASMHAPKRTALSQGASFRVLGSSANGAWLRVRLAGGSTGWVAVGYACGPDVPGTGSGSGSGSGSNGGVVTGDGSTGSGTAGSGTGTGSGNPVGGPGNGLGSPNAGPHGTPGTNGGSVGSRPTNDPANDTSGGGFDPSALGGLADMLGGGGGSNGGGGGGSNGGGGGSNGGAQPMANALTGDDPVGSSDASGSDAPGSTTAPTGTSTAPGVFASPEECARPAPQPAFDPLAGIDRFCESCVASRLESLGLTIADLNRVQGSVDRVQDTMGAILGAVETGSRTPDYGQITVDSGGITYGFYQADRRSGELSNLLKRYVQLARPTNETRALARYAQQMAGGRGAALDRSRELQNLLRRAAHDPAMQQAQRETFRKHHMEPSMQKAADLGIRSPLGVAVYMDIQVNGGIASIVKAARRQVPRIASPADEVRFIRAMIEAREARYKRLAARGMRKYLAGWLSRNNDFRRLLNAGNLDLTGNVPVNSKGFSFCGGTPDDAAAFRSHMESLTRRA